MTRSEQHSHNRRVIQRVALLVHGFRSFHAPSYQQVTVTLNTELLLTSRGNTWTSKSLFRMLQRSGISGLHGVKKIRY